MSEPIFAATMERLWSRLPDVYRQADADLGWPLKGWLNGIVAEQDVVDALVERFDYTSAADLTPSQKVSGVTGEDMTLGTLHFDPPASWTFATGKYQLTSTSAGSFIDVDQLLFGGDYQLVVNYDRGQQGIADVLIDLNVIAQLDEFGTAGTVDSAVIPFSVSRGYHNIRLNFTNTKNASSTDTRINVRTIRIVNVSANAVDTSDLVDPNAADDAWLDWLGQLIGVTLDAGLSELERRDAVRFASSGFRSGTKQALGDAAKSVLTGTRFVQVFDHSTGTIGGIGAGTQWEVLITTRASETPAGVDVIAAVTRKGAKPAGVKLYARTYSADWATVEANFVTWAQWDGTPWQTIEETGLS